MDKQTLVAERERLLCSVIDYFRGDPAVVGLFLGGSLPAGTADAYSDIDLRVVVEDDAHARFVANRLTMPHSWGRLLFNEWLEGTQHCVSHFYPFGKIDVFYLRLGDFTPNPWYGLATEILYDPVKRIQDIIYRSKGLAFSVSVTDVDRAISKALASLHEAYRRLRRNDLFFAQSLLDGVRHYMIRADDWVNDRPPQAVTFSNLQQRASGELLESFAKSYVSLNAQAMDTALLTLATGFRTQVVALHEKFRLQRPLVDDLYAIDVIVNRAIE